MLKFKEKTADWWVAVLALQEAINGPVELTVNGSKTAIKINPEPDPKWYSTDRGLNLDALSRDLPPMPLRPALEAGLQDTSDKILQLYAMLRSLFSGRVSLKTLGGPCSDRTGQAYSPGQRTWASPISSSSWGCSASTWR